MISVSRANRRALRPPAASLWPSIAVATGVIALGACAHSTASTGSEAPSPTGDMSTAPPSPDPRVGLKGGLWDAGQAEWNMHLVSNTHPSEAFAGKGNSDIAFSGNYAIQGGFNGVQ